MTRWAALVMWRSLSCLDAASPWMIYRFHPPGILLGPQRGSPKKDGRFEFYENTSLRFLLSWILKVFLRKCHWNWVYISSWIRHDMRNLSRPWEDKWCLGGCFSRGESLGVYMGPWRHLIEHASRCSKALQGNSPGSIARSPPSATTTHCLKWNRSLHATKGSSDFYHNSYEHQTALVYTSVSPTQSESTPSPSLCYLCLYLSRF